METIKVTLEYPLVLNKSYLSGNSYVYMGIKEGIKDLQNTTKTLEEIAESSPVSPLQVHLENHEIAVSYISNIERVEDLQTLIGVLKCFSSLPKEYRPNCMLIHGAKKYLKVVEGTLNEHGKTLQYSKAKGVGSFLDYILPPSNTVVRDLKRSGGGLLL